MNVVDDVVEVVDVVVKGRHSKQFIFLGRILKNIINISPSAISTFIVIQIFV